MTRDKQLREVKSIHVQEEETSGSTIDMKTVKEIEREGGRERERVREGFTQTSFNDCSRQVI